MENYSYHVPFYVLTNGVATQGFTSDLAGGQLGLFDRQNFAVATAIGQGKELFFAQGALGSKGFHGEPVTDSHKSPFFFVKDIVQDGIYLSLPAKIQNEEWVLGYDGSQSSKSLEYIKGQPTRIKLYFHGEPVYRMFNGPKEYMISYTPPEDCTTDCATECGGDRQDPKPHAIKHINLINSNPEMKKLGVTAKLVENTYSAATPTRKIYTLEVMDEGTGLALAKIQGTYPTVKVKRISRSGIKSVYQFDEPIGDAAPADFQYDGGSIGVLKCDQCAAGYTLSAGSSVFYVSRPLAGTEDLDDNTARQTFADAIAAQYKTAKAMTIPTSDVNTATDVITETAHGYATGSKVTYLNGGGTSITGLTSGNDYYVIKVSDDTYKVASSFANAAAGTAIDLTGTGNNAQTFSPAITASYLGHDGSVATVKLTAPEGYSTPSAYLSDTISDVVTGLKKCTAPAGATVAWVLGSTCVSGSRTLKIKLNRNECTLSSDRRAEVLTALTNVKGVDTTTLATIAGDACADEYTVVQNSDDCLDEACLTSNQTFTYDTPLPMIDGKAWEVLDPSITPDTTRKVGIRITAGYFDPKFGNCSFDPYDYYEQMPIKMEVSLLKEDLTGCAYANLATQNKIKNARIGRQSGEYVVREVLMKTEAYLKHVKQWDNDVRTREAFDMQLLNTVDRNAYYKLWYISFEASYNRTSRTGTKEKFTTVVAVKESDPNEQVFVTNVINVLSAKSGVVPYINS